MTHGPKASAHAIYDLKYHFVLTSKYRKELLIGETAEATKKLRIETPIATLGKFSVDMNKNMLAYVASGAIHVIHDNDVRIEEEIKAIDCIANPEAISVMLDPGGSFTH